MPAFVAKWQLPDYDDGSVQDKPILAGIFGQQIFGRVHAK